MRIVDTIPHHALQISIFQMNDKYLVKFEAAMLEQVFKFDIAEIKSIEALKQIINPEFIDMVRKRFNEMYLQYKAAF
jgi:hypothetical protein